MRRCDLREKPEKNKHNKRKVRTNIKKPKIKVTRCVMINFDGRTKEAQIESKFPSINNKKKKWWIFAQEANSKKKLIQAESKFRWDFDCVTDFIAWRKKNLALILWSHIFYNFILFRTLSRIPVRMVQMSSITAANVVFNIMFDLRNFHHFGSQSHSLQHSMNTEARVSFINCK